ncbi:MAG: dienelactone hydrolase family protein [Bernardetiaceae bacterium]|nr:dienelactone hydrolase family protein [Bernardetiaceae bacterium]
MHVYKIVQKGSPLHQAKKAIILLHGRGASAEDIMGLADVFCDDSFYIAAPQATHNSWYPYSFLAPETQNEPWLSSAVATVKQLIDEISQYVTAEKMYIMGFSQGACLSLEVAARFAQRYAGVAAFTGGLIGEQLKPEKYNGNFNGTPVFIGNSDQDPHVPIERSKASAQLIKNMGAQVVHQVYPNMPHTIIREEILAVKNMMF